MFFGSSASPLYGVYHPPKARAGRRTGIVLCAPFGQEYMRSHRAFRQLALLLAKAGYHVFRFDYRGTGDSWGEDEVFTLAGAVEDTRMAIEELQDTADVSDVALVGLRLGATVALAVASADGSEETGLVLWDPVLDGAAYRAELQQVAVQASAGVRGAPALNAMGFMVTSTLQAELDGILPDRVQTHAQRALLMVGTADAIPSSSEVLTADGQPAERLIEPIAGRWDEVDNWGSAMIPQKAIQTIVQWIGQNAP